MAGTTPLLQVRENGKRCELSSPTAMPQAGGFLWNQKMMMHATCRGYTTAQFMQPEPAKYSHAPNIEAKTFMQPEQNYYAHHPGRFVYIKDEGTGELFSAPYEPVRGHLDGFSFSQGQADLTWTVEKLGVRVTMTVTLPVDDVSELWTVGVENLTDRPRRLSIYPYFVIGYKSWMNQGAVYNEELNAVVARCIAPYQKVADYPKQKYFKDKTYLLCETSPHSWETRQSAFEGEGGLHGPSSILDEVYLSKSDAIYETPAAVVQYREEIAAKDSREYRFMFGPAFDDAEIKEMKNKYLSKAAFAKAQEAYSSYIQSGAGCLRVETPDEGINNFVNNWLARQCFYHGDVNRLSTDPQTRNYLQDLMGMCYIKPETARGALAKAISQQEPDGSMPDGIILYEGGELKYINQIPHTDHCVWLPIALDLYLAETADYGFLREKISTKNGDSYTVFERFSRAMDWLLQAHDERGLSYLAQGDWCDPLNMAGYKGKGVSGWLTLATAYAVKLWAAICSQTGEEEQAKRFMAGADRFNKAANEHLWDGDWFARGITDDNVKFGVSSDPEGRIWLNPQAWSILGGAASKEQTARMMAQVEKQLYTPYGVVMFGPPFSGMREDVGRVTQKWPGSAENASVYNHASVFYIHSLYSINETDKAHELLRQMIPGPEEKDYLQRGQMPNFIPNYYRGAYREYPRTAGRSSQLFNTGTASWVYRCFVEGLCGLKGEADGLRIAPQLPSSWEGIKVTRLFRGAEFKVDMKRADIDKITVSLDGRTLPEAKVVDIKPEKTYELSVALPRAS
ncbi:hypothetical protein N3K66_003447 [Trichothecium roseum]|uniref:Uncharacterized protein n=1 Tax=Trichothecium roseum TaxID=47278 RepID=A0ACC0V591_9HYPO|nr:hypothetical protein N3K66_003447 [Trichothecium roseum]